MTDQRETRALDRLSQFEGGRPAAAAPAPEVRGRPGAQMAASIVLPGLPSMRRVPALGLLLFTVGVAVPIVLVAWIVSQRGDLVGMALEPRFLTAVVAVGLAIVLARLLAVAEVAHAFRHRRGIGASTTVATLIVLVLAVPVLIGAFRANEARSAVASVFGSGGPAIYVPSEPGVDPDAITNILLLGGDEGPGRWGMRTDTMILVSVHEASGRTALVSIPRNLRGLLWPAGTPLGERFPDGFDEYDGLANAVFTYVTSDDMLLAHYSDGGRQGQAVALAEGIGYSLDVELDDYSLVNMQGFTEIIDAVGGVTLDLSQSVPLPPSLPGERPLPASIGPGPVEMDGAMAIAYVRSRAGDSDYQRMQRQRQLLAALGSQVSPTDAAAGFTKVTGALDDSMRTSMSGGEFSSLLDRLGDNSNIGESIGLVPPLVEPGRPDWAQVRTIIDAVQNYVLTGEPSGFAG